MKGWYVALGAVALIVTGGVVGAVALGITPVDVADLTSSDSGPGETTPKPDRTDGANDETSTASGGGTDGGDSNGSDNLQKESPDSGSKFAFTVLDIKECGTTCRDVTVEATNTMGTTASNVTITTRIYTEGDKVWQGSESFPEIASEESKTRTKRVKLGYYDAMKIKNNDGYITIETTITWDGGKQVFSERRKVA